jgi:hypothetical protein
VSTTKSDPLRAKAIRLLSGAQAKLAQEGHGGPQPGIRFSPLPSALTTKRWTFGGGSPFTPQQMCEPRSKAKRLPSGDQANAPYAQVLCGPVHLVRVCVPEPSGLIVSMRNQGVAFVLQPARNAILPFACGRTEETPTWDDVCDRAELPSGPDPPRSE